MRMVQSMRGKGDAEKEAVKTQLGKGEQEAEEIQPSKEIEQTRGCGGNADPLGKGGHKAQADFRGIEIYNIFSESESGEEMHSDNKSDSLPIDGCKLMQHEEEWLQA